MKTGSSPSARLRGSTADTHPIAGAAAADGSAVRLLTELLDAAARRGASDLHLEPDGDGWRVRFRVDGVLSEVARPAPALRELLITRIKVLARLDIAERRLPQDGRLTIIGANGDSQDYRVNTLPTTAGEKIVLRRLQTLPLNLTLADLGFDETQRHVLEGAIHAPHGMILVTGPTGSGKTVSLYSFLQQLDRRSFNICTVEDPAEIRLAGINQVGIQEKAGLTFAQTLRAFLRQDPDVIMVGEIRDAETASVAIKAAQTGHLVFSTLHTNDAPATLARLLDIGVEPFNIAAAVRLITAQRLLRKLCPACCEPLTISAATWRAAGGTEAMQSDGFYPKRAVGCAACHGTGFRGRAGIHQVMPISEAMRQIIVARGSASELARQALSEGIASLRSAALMAVARGEASLEEAVCATDRVH
ncbi:MAG: GspE/PulE family protein [Janthinobacterium lividum]